MVCHNCEIEAKKHGKDRKGNQRWKCERCNKTYSERPEKPIARTYVPADRLLSIVKLLVEGCSIRTIERVTGTHRDTILSLLVQLGEKCERILDDRIQDVPVTDVQADEIWTYVSMKEKTKVRLGKDSDDQLGDAYTFVGIERHTKLVLACDL